MKFLSVVASFLAVMVMTSVVAGQHQHDHGQQDTGQQRLEQSPRHHQWVEIPTLQGRMVKTFVAFPEVDHPATAVIVIHENRGLTDWVRTVADKLAEKGYVALAPDLLSGTAPGGGGTSDYSSSDAARAGIYELPAEQVTADLDAVAKYARELTATNDTVAVAGFCWGGSQTFRYATHNPQLAAAFVFYGSTPEAEQLKKLEVPVYGFYGGKDFRITGNVPETKQQLKKLGKTYKPVVYEGAGHGFMRAGAAPDASDANAQAMKQAWERLGKLLNGLKENSNN